MAKQKFQTELIPASQIKLNPNNPRLIKDDKYKKLVQSIKDFPEMLHIRPIVVNDEMIVLGGNMRLRACIEAGMKEIPTIKASSFTEEQQKEFLIKDNVGFGEWDWDILANEFDEALLPDWGIDTWGGKVASDGLNFVDEDEAESDGQGMDAPSAHVKMIQIFCAKDVHEKLMDKIKSLSEKHSASNISDTVIAVIMSA